MGVTAAARNTAAEAEGATSNESMKIYGFSGGKVIPKDPVRSNDAKSSDERFVARW
jgi:hypothetical protein